MIALSVCSRQDVRGDFFRRGLRAGRQSTKIVDPPINDRRNTVTFYPLPQMTRVGPKANTIGSSSQLRPTRLNQRDLDSSCYRLSRVPQKFAMSKAVKSETSESYAAAYYSQNPPDTSPPEDKLAAVDSKLSESGLEDDDQFTLLVQRKTLCQMIYGENSPEAVQATTKLGAFYNQHGKPDSALRNLTKAKQSSQQTELAEEDSFALALEYADANVNGASSSRQDKTKQVALADNALSPYAEFEVDDGMLKFRRDLLLARIRGYRTKWNDSLAFYQRALENYQATHPAEEGESEEKNPEQANIYVEAAAIAERIDGCDQAPEYYKRAYDLYVDLGFEEDAQKIESKIGAADDGQEPEEGQPAEEGEEGRGEEGAEPPAEGEGEPAPADE
jgi:hypothetical protein